METHHFSASSMFKSTSGNLQDQIQRDGDSLTSKCGSDVKDVYDTSAHVYALILILVLSTMACGFPLLSRKISKNPGSSTFIFLSQHFGTGVLIATAFVHLLPTAFISLTHPCLTLFFSRNYTPLAGLIAMTSTLFVVGLEMYLTLRGLGHSHSHTEHHSTGEGGRLIHSKILASRRNQNKDLRLSLTQRNSSLYDLDASEGLMANLTPLSTSTPVLSPQVTANPETHYDRDSEIYDEMDHLTTHVFPQHELMDEALNEDSQSPGISSKVELKRKILQCLMLEAGILFHSIFIGMALSVATGPPFVVFLIAIGFHQSFEGMALGSRIAAIEFPSRSPRPWLMILAYGITTPIGQGVGIAMHNMYDPESAAGLLIVGVMNGVSSGLLLYAGLVQLLAEDFLSHNSYKLLKGTRRVKAFCSVIAGAFLMALVGAWA
ncbi:Zinc-regulated transporter 2 [Golovinomyces cichoracearum]|uniref:Zinc-regulated transporter 2 n=1 Tax=Golovinomyces cichoracearum TaxID=62708 RepID=A0A420IWZ6_9PEZI|nr:Zinc-regulated transporter 2 [Golovinomyces cichoracearum]